MAAVDSLRVFPAFIYGAEVPEVNVGEAVVWLIEHKEDHVWRFWKAGRFVFLTAEDAVEMKLRFG